MKKIAKSLLILIFTSALMHITYFFLVPYCEISSYYWYLDRRVNSWHENPKILVLGDSQIISGITPETIAEIENVNVDRVVYEPRPSEQPEGILDKYYRIKKQYPSIRKIYLNISPISITRNSVTDAHKQLYYSFGEFRIHQLVDEDLRRAYFSSFYDLVWKWGIEVFPFFGLNGNFSSVFSILPSNSQFYEFDPETNSSLSKNPSLEILKTRKNDSLYLEKHWDSLGRSWVWKDFGTKQEINKNSIFPRGSAIGFTKKREASIRIFRKLINEVKQSNISIVCLDIPFSFSLEKDMEEHGVKDLFERELEDLEGCQRIRLNREKFKEMNLFKDWTHLNEKGRDVLHQILISWGKN
ncbi:hypothetical protein [Leptospira ilyithenensis]|uniref:Uncharacterized protein n=1 Tax=Leptospira ilyithenensis TaxID=2484901 RepID=A0A4V3JXA5_9LEPT|nr:hypothetical protein [Leptospira ilyithenensis]TGN10551.1 hypothetical protein EHS11_09705 [Leptospira ilyithenensis]